MLSYEISAEGDGYLFKMAGKSDGYLAVGLSPDNDKMGDDLTTACYHDQNGQVSTLIYRGSPTYAVFSLCTRK